MADTPRRKDAEMAKPEWMNQNFCKSSPKTQTKQINGVKDMGSPFHKPAVRGYADGSEGGVWDGIKNFFSGEGQDKRDQEVTKNAIGASNNKGCGDTGLWDRLKAGNIDDPKSEAYYRWGAGKETAAAIKAQDDKEFEAIDKSFTTTGSAKATAPAADDRNEMDKSSDSFKAEAPKKQTFGQAFKSAKDGSTFEWNGKPYKKEYASKSTPSSTAKSSESKTSTNNVSVQVLSEQISDLNKRIDDPKVSASDKKNFEFSREALRKQMVANASRTK